MKAVIFTYPPDYVMASYASESLHRCGVGVTLAIDQNDPELFVENCEIVRTSFKRNGNLNGMATVIGQLETLKMVSDGSQYILKVDSDSMVFSTDWLSGRNEDVVGLRSNENLHKRSLYGFCYGVKESSVSSMLDLARSLPDNDWCPEDIMTGTLASRVGNLFTFRHLDKATRLGAFRWTDKGSVQDWRRDFDALCFQRNMIISGSRRSDRSDIRKAMKNFLTA